ncbi:MAG TPA: L,D-transpeptidase family protein [Solirubrobacteraceae bacterium]|nr:L,D-transpeptidase family protein [Solirubrobacteraceae bacterium]
MRKAGLALLFLLGFLAAGGLSAGVLAATTTGTTTTTTEPALIAPGVTISGVDVGNVTEDEAFQAVTDSFARPLLLSVPRHRLAVVPARIGAMAAVRAAVRRALAAPAGTELKLRVIVSRRGTQRYLDALARRFDRAAVDSHLLLRGLRPWVTRPQVGRALRQTRAMDAIFTALVTNTRPLLQLQFATLEPAVTRSSVGPVIVIRRGSNRLYLYKGVRPWRAFGVATGQSRYPTPLGRWHVVVKWRNPWWYPPNSDWAKGEKPIPPGPGNPLGTRWMGLSASGVGIHGTPDDASIGYSASHGCIRMHIPDAEWLFNHVTIGTTVFIVSA